jgi:hypothetical protein
VIQQFKKGDLVVLKDFFDTRYQIIPIPGILHMVGTLKPSLRKEKRLFHSMQQDIDFKQEDFRFVRRCKLARLL